ncbi:hypothetical protein NLM59_07325 [Weeksellaceae bacterium KMM 9724]|uniref:hypothetical protein n=1 Tax=Profundicola chukchiensis TaxID=2961959 RepID=UPI002438F33D|nr:hypothetical protein [Profundicola chukchiensis]MDG4950731.1 hypothetical protein [Profundicola chukchiensis]
MAFLEDHKAKFDNLRTSLSLQRRDELKRKANGGNSIIFTYPPEEEKLYISKFEEINDKDEFYFINIAQLLVDFIDMDGWADFKYYYNSFKNTPHIVFNSDDESTDLMDLILNEISKAESLNKIPVLLRTGALYGTGIENVNIMENKIVMNLKQPLVILYPSKLVNDSLLFLNFKPASKYRCTVID